MRVEAELCRFFFVIKNAATDQDGTEMWSFTNQKSIHSCLFSLFAIFYKTTKHVKLKKEPP